MDELSRLTSEAIAEISSDPQVLNMKRVIDGQFDTWTNELFPLLQAKKIGCYRYVVDLLHRAGYTVATEELVRKYFSVIRAKRNLKTSAFQALSPTQALPATRKPVAVPAPEVRVAPAPPVAQVAPPVQAVSAPVDDQVWWIEQMQRMNLENGSSPWTGDDQAMWNHFEKVGTTIGRPVEGKNIILFERFMDDPVKKSCLSSLLPKKRKFS